VEQRVDFPARGINSKLQPPGGALNDEHCFPFAARKPAMVFPYPPDKQEKATQTVLEQAKLLCAEWAD
jgi:hypothetical protein